MTKLSVNINKVALLRNSRGRDFPSVVKFARRCLELGAHGITLHPRPDQRHARYSDVRALAPLVAEFGAELNVEGNPTDDFLEVVLDVRPHQCTLVPDDPGQLTSDHGWNLRRDEASLRAVLGRLKDRGIRTSVFVDHDYAEIGLARAYRADRVELYTEPYAERFGGPETDRVLAAFGEAARRAQAAGLGVNAGHDLNLSNLARFLTIPGILEVSIGHALIAECIEHGIEHVIRHYVALCGG